MNSHDVSEAIDESVHGESVPSTNSAHKGSDGAGRQTKGSTH